MRHPADLQDAEFNSAPERVRRYRTKPLQGTVYMKAVLCQDCDKQGYRTAEAARIIISRMLTNGTLRGPDAYSFRPYLCPHGWWHTGHDYRTRRLVTDMLSGKQKRAAGANQEAIKKTKPKRPLAIHTLCTAQL